MRYRRYGGMIPAKGGTMKRSEYEAARKESWAYRETTNLSWSACVAYDVAAAEAAGVVWDPEEEPMAERIWPSVAIPDSWEMRAKVDDLNDRLANYRELSIAADLYNRREAIASVIGELRAWHAASQEGRNHVWPGPKRLADRLEGRE